MILALWVALALGGSEAPEPGEATLIYYNARLALREGRAADAVKLWLLRNTYSDATGRVSTNDEDFHSVTWAALGELGVCPDGHRRDDDGAGLWPLALHNWLVMNRNTRPRTDIGHPFEVFELDRQQRGIAINDVLDAKELGTVQFRRGRCLAPRIAMIAAGEIPWASLRDRQVATRLLAYLLEASHRTLGPNVQGKAAVEARLFDVHLQLIELAAIEARRRAREAGRRGFSLGLNRPSVSALQREAPTHTFADDSEPAKILRASVGWTPDEWMTLSPDRRVFIYDQAVKYLGRSEALDGLALALIDEMAVRGLGAEAQAWVARRGAASPAIWDGERGLRLMALDPSTGFTERSTIALHRGVAQLEAGDLDAALRSFGAAVTHSPESAASAEVHALGLRWLSYVASRFEIDEGLLLTLRELVPPREYSVILEDLVWSAALHADAASFEIGQDHQVGRGALARRVALLAPLARGDAKRFVAGIEAGLRDAPGETIRFLDQFVQRLELEDAEVRDALAPMLIRLRATLERHADPEDRQGRRIDALLDRTLAILDGLGPRPGDGARDRARQFAPDAEVFAGSIRLAPSDPLPWPFAPAEVRAPGVFTPLTLRPVEWRGEDGAWVFGWRVEG